MKRQIERVIPKQARPGMVGDGFRVYNFIPGAVLQRRISPFLMLDFAAEFNFTPSEKVRGVDVHPHKGFETVTIAYKGSVAHHDSAGNSGIINSGDVQWMTAGAGILHKEYHEQEFSKRGGPFEMVQLWVNLPKKHKSVAPHYQAITADKMGKYVIPNNGGIVNVIAGKVNDVKGPAATYSPVNLFDIKLNKGAELNFTIPASHNAAMLMVNGTALADETAVAEHSFVLFKDGGEEITIKADSDAVILFMSGEPINEPIASYGPFVMNTQEEIYEAIEEFQAGKFGTLV
ncbi:MAG: pirin family protein [Sphingobacteriales bacterium]|nr:MAG: pirin family protein [Sphingobacteriales bacterium]